MYIFSATCDSRDHQMGSDPMPSWDYRLKLLICPKMTDLGGGADTEPSPSINSCVELGY